MSTLKNKYLRVKALTEEWANKQGHDQCWYYPDLFRKIADVMRIEYKEPNLPPRCEFNQGCERYEDEVYGARWKRRTSTLPDYLL